MSKEKYIKCLKTIKRIFDKNEIVFWLDYGTLWGAIRDKKIMKFDTDIDVGVWIDDVPKISQLKKTFKKEGYDLRVNPNHLNYVIHDLKTGEHLGCILFRDVSRGYMIRIKFHPLFKILIAANFGNGGWVIKKLWKFIIKNRFYTDMEVSSKFEDLGFYSEIEFYDETFMIPEHPILYLDFMYCNRDWRKVATEPLHGKAVGRRRQRLHEFSESIPKIKK